MLDLIEHDGNEKHIELEVMMIRIRGRCFSFFYWYVMEILFEHPWFLVINKPTDLLTQAVKGIDSVQTRLQKLLKERNPNGASPFIGIPHRLDRVTTGIMVVARNQRALRRLSEQFAARTIKKTYHAIVPNKPELDQMAKSENPQKWIDFIRKITDEARGEVVSSDAAGARKAVLVIRLLSVYAFSPQRSTFRMCEIELETGRMHQIRLQLAHRGFPILGDQLYGSTVPWLDGDFRNPPIALHARTLSFRHPQTAEVLRFEAPYPKAWSRLTPCP